jgi:diguanylate cyclase (GGDEF)-like protein
MNSITRLERQNKPLLLLTGFLLIAVIGILDYLTGYEFAFSVFYVLPISLVTWRAGRRIGLLASLMSAIAWLAADLASRHQYSNPFVPAWNTLIRFAFFIIITLLLGALRNSLQRESELARMDYLTGAVNSRFFYELADMEIERLRRYNHPFTIAYIDLDNFKTVNDKFGHATGDKILTTMSGAVKRQIRKTDIFARLGGDEFVLLLPETSEEAAQAVVTKLHDELTKKMLEDNWSVTFSIGVLTCNLSPDSVEELVRYADKLMYAAKNEGKNRVKYSSYPGNY